MMWKCENGHCMKMLFIFLFTCQLPGSAFSQVSKDEMKSLNLGRIETSRVGMKVLTGWGAVNTITGVAGCLTANSKEWKAFHGMNAIWGITNAGIGLMGLAGVRKEMKRESNCSDMLQRYESTKRLFLINGGLDFLYIGTGVFLREHAKTEAKPDVWRGFGNSILIQGVFLLLFDGTMYAAHQGKNKKWYKALNGLCVSDKGLGLSYTF